MITAADVIRGVGHRGCLRFTKIFREIRLESKWNTTFWVFPTENFQEQRNIWKASPVFLDGIFQPEIRDPFLQAIFNISFRPSRPFSVKWNWSVQMVKAIPRRNLPFLNFANHLPRPWTDRFAHVNGKQLAEKWKWSPFKVAKDTGHETDPWPKHSLERRWQKFICSRESSEWA